MSSNTGKLIIAFIPARGGSKGVPRKNIKLLHGKPLIAHAIETAFHSAVIDRVFVTTEDDEIAQVAKQFGAEIIERPKELAGDHVVIEPVLKHALGVIEKMGLKPDFIALLPPTSPLLKSEIVKQCVDKVVHQGFDSCFTAYIPTTYEFKWRKVGESDLVKPELQPGTRVVRQLQPKVYHENGAFYITKASLIKKTGHHLGGRTTIVEMNNEDSIQIDSPNQFWLIDQILKRRTKE